MAGVFSGHPLPVTSGFYPKEQKNGMEQSTLQRSDPEVTGHLGNEMLSLFLVTENKLLW